MSERKTIPRGGRARGSLLEEMQDLRCDDARYREGRTWSLVYYVDPSHHDFLEQAHNTFFAENALNPMAFKSLKRMESEVVQMTASMLAGPDSCVGTMTSGGTESLLMVVKSMRDRARRRRPWIRRPNMVVPRTVHAAFDKAAHYFGVKVRYVEVGPDFRADVRAMERAIDRNTILLVGSAPQYPHGVVDPIAQLGALAQRKKLPLHVDACFGGFMLPWLEKLGHPVPTWDFRVPGVTSVSADVHKYGYAAKGASVLLYRDMSYLRHQFFVSTDWPGGIYASPSMPGTRPGGPIAAAWAAMQVMGEEGYTALAEQALETTRKLRAGIDAIPELRVLGDFHCTSVTWASQGDAVNVYAVADLMAEKSWSCDRQQRPPSIHLTVNANNADVADQYLADLAESTARAAREPQLADEGEAAMYGMMAKVPLRGLVKHSVGKVMESMYDGSTEMPDLGNLGEDTSSGPVVGFINRHGDKALDAIDWFNNSVRTLRPGRRR